MSKRKRQIGEPEVNTRRSIRPGRQTRPRWSSFFGMLPYNYIPRRQYESYDISKLENSSLTAAQLLALLPDLSADVGLAVWNILRLGSSGFDYTAKDASGNDDERSKVILDEIVGRINNAQGGIRQLICQWLMTGFLQGAVAGEVALAEALDDIDDFYVVDPYTIKFSRDEAGKLVPMHQPPGSGMAEALNTSKFWYIPIDPWVDDPYGRPPAAPALQEVWFDVAVITDLRRVVHNQGWPRIDIEVLEEVLVNAAPATIKNDPQRLRDWLDDRLEDVSNAYNDLQPDDSFVHFDSVKINAASGQPGRLFDVGQLTKVIEHRLIKSLKQLPILMGSNEGTTETHGTVQWQIFVNGLRSLQEPIEFILSQMLRLTLEVRGVSASVECWFKPIRTTDRLSDAQAEHAEIENAIRKWAAGWQSWEESSIEITGSAPPEGSQAPDPSMLLGGGAAMMLSAGEGITTAVDPETVRLRREVGAWLDVDTGIAEY